MADLAEREGARMLYLPTARTADHPPAARPRALECVRTDDPSASGPTSSTPTPRRRAFSARRRRCSRYGRARRSSTPSTAMCSRATSGPQDAASTATLERGLAPTTDRLIGVSQATVDDLVAPRGRAAGEVRVVPLGLDLEPFRRASSRGGAPPRGELGLARRRGALHVFVGRLVPIKRSSCCCARSPAPARAAPPLRLAVVGDGEIAPELESLAAALGLRRRRSTSSATAATCRGSRRRATRRCQLRQRGHPGSLIEAGPAGCRAVARPTSAGSPRS